MRWLFGSLLFFLVSTGLLAFLATDSQALVDRPETISPHAVAQAKRLLYLNDPRRMRPGEQRVVAVPAFLLDEGANYFASRVLGGRGALVLSDRKASLHFSVRLPPPLATRYANLRFTIPEGEGAPRIASAAVGRLPLPASLAEFMVAAAVRFLGYEKEWQSARGVVRRLTFAPADGKVVVAFVWEPALLDQARAAAVPADDLKRMAEAQAALAAILTQRRAGAAVPLPEVLKTLLTADGRRSIEQRRAALFVLAAHQSERNLASVIPEARQWPRPTPVEFTLLGRHDSAQHFLISAALAAWAGEPVAEAIGLYKELEDARHGSGFSFADLAADRAGTRFGEVLARHPERLDGLLAQPFGDNDLMPALDGLPEYLSQRQFRSRFGGPGSPAYEKLSREIDRRLLALPLYR